MDVSKAFTYCPRCSNLLKANESFLKCDHCGLSYYINPKPCTSVILQNSNNEYLLVERAIDPKKGWWDFPGGFVEVGETFEEGAKRELKEELGIAITNLEYIGSFYDLYNYQDVLYPTLAVNYLGKLDDNHEQLKPADDVASYRFLSLHDIPKDKLAFPSILETLKLLEELAGK